VGNELTMMSVLVPALQAQFAGGAKLTEAVFASIKEGTGALVDQLTKDSVEADRAVGALAGLTIGDAVGAPLEFIDSDSSPPPYARGRPHLKAELNDKGSLQYEAPFNKFRLYNGQWTDDASMALCMADSLIERKKYDGSDCRARYHYWWNFGYNNAFRFDRTPGRRSVGLGGNISKSLDEIDRFEGKAAVDVPARFTATGEDAGNGSIMRLAPIPVRYHANLEEGISQAIESSLATHPGNDAAACCAFMTYLQVKAIHRPPEDASLSLSQFLDKQIDGFIRDVASRGANSKNSGMQKVVTVLKGEAPSPKEAVWAWKAPRLAIEETLHARGTKYNGYPVFPGYFGAYCMDGMAMALWALRHSTSFVECALKVTNLLGDCDTTGAIACQVAGAFYGYRSIAASGPMGQTFVRNLRQWDPMHEVELRALILFDDGARASAPTAGAAEA